MTLAIDECDSDAVVPILRAYEPALNTRYRPDEAWGCCVVTCCAGAQRWRCRRESGPLLAAQQSTVHLCPGASNGINNVRLFCNVASLCSHGLSSSEYLLIATALFVVTVFSTQPRRSVMDCSLLLVSNGAVVISTVGFSVGPFLSHVAIPRLIS